MQLRYVSTGCTLDYAPHIASAQIVSLTQCAGEDLVRAWGAPGPWVEGAGGVFAPEEVRLTAMLPLAIYPIIKFIRLLSHSVSPTL